MKLKYFAWVRERIGTGEEDIELPAGVVSVRSVFLRGFLTNILNPKVIVFFLKNPWC